MGLYRDEVVLLITKGSWPKGGFFHTWLFGVGINEG